jgi:hypothetical protein
MKHTIKKTGSTYTIFVGSVPLIEGILTKTFAEEIVTNFKKKETPKRKD